MYIRLYRIGSYGRLTEKEHLPFWALRAVPLVIELGSCKSRTYPQGQNKKKYPPPPICVMIAAQRLVAPYEE